MSANSSDRNPNENDLELFYRRSLQYPKDLLVSFQEEQMLYKIETEIKIFKIMHYF